MGQERSNAALVCFDETGVAEVRVRKRTRLGDAVTMRVREADSYSKAHVRAR